MCSIMYETQQLSGSVQGRKEGRVLVMFPLRLLMTTINSHATGTSNSLQGSIGGFLTSTEGKKKSKKTDRI